MRSADAAGERSNQSQPSRTRPGSRAVTAVSSSMRVLYFADPDADRASGIVSLFNGEPDFPTPPWICAAATEAMQAGYTHYSRQQGDLELRTAVADGLNEAFGQDYQPADIVITSGASSGIFSSVAALVDPGDEVLLVDPCYSLYDDVVRIVGGVPVRVRTASDFHLDAEALNDAITPRCKLLVLCNPCNPTAVVFSRAELEQVERIAVERDIMVLSDEVYREIVYDGRPFVSTIALPELAERTLLVQSFSKSYAMTGWRVGYVAARGGLARLVSTAQRTSQQLVNTMAQRAALAAIRADEASAAWFAEALAIYDHRRHLVSGLLAQIPRVRYREPEGTFYSWVQVETSMTSLELMQYLREVGRVAVHAGSEYGPGGEGYIRLSFATDDATIRAGISRLGEALARLEV
ncbi:MAG: aminotransferase class I/II-fold pyridoxal phosphate-dependent enzyme [Chloroflexi bacterium]|nr:aminotransferase class I/II-fold pyridoxal phosphate-dependent enzyme [Chloroflexota bacterium]